MLNLPPVLSPSPPFLFLACQAATAAAAIGGGDGSGGVTPSAVNGSSGTAGDACQFRPQSTSMSIPSQLQNMEIAEDSLRQNFQTSMRLLDEVFEHCRHFLGGWGGVGEGVWKGQVRGGVDEYGVSTLFWSYRVLSIPYSVFTVF